MITKKEDLIGRYALRSEKEVFELFMQKCEEFGLVWVSGQKPRIVETNEAVSFTPQYGGLTHATEGFLLERGESKITLSDLKEEKQMKIDYELAEKIGATHYIGETLYRFTDDAKIECYYTSNEKWMVSVNRPEDFIRLKPTPKPRTRTEYEKVTESIFDLREEFERGELFNESLDCSGDLVAINSEIVLLTCVKAGNVYRKVEKPVDWREEVANWLGVDDWSEDDNLGVINDAFVGLRLDYFTESQFLEMCRVTLRALGEIE